MLTKIKYFSIWLLISLLLLVLYSYKGELKGVKERVLATLFIGSVVDQDNVLIVQKSKDRHFYINVKLNGAEVRFLVDTGATSVSLTKEDAAKVGIEIDELNFDIKTYTASGISKSAKTNVKSIEIGGYRTGPHPVLVMSGNSDISLLGITFLQEFRYYKFEGDRLYLAY